MRALFVALCFALAACNVKPQNLDQSIYASEATLKGVQVAIENCVVDPTCKISTAALIAAEDKVQIAKDSLATAHTATAKGDLTTASDRLAAAQTAISIAKSLVPTGGK